MDNLKKNVIVTGTGMMVLYFFQLSLFGATLGIYARLEHKNRHGIFVCKLQDRNKNGEYALRREF